MLRDEHQVTVAPGDPSPEPLRHLPLAMLLEEVQERGRALEGEFAFAFTLPEDVATADPFRAPVGMRCAIGRATRLKQTWPFLTHPGLHDGRCLCCLRSFLQARRCHCSPQACGSAQPCRQCRSKRHAAPAAPARGSRCCTECRRDLWALGVSQPTRASGPTMESPRVSPRRRGPRAAWCPPVRPCAGGPGCWPWHRARRRAAP